MGKTFAEYQAEHTKKPFGLPMPDGSSIPLPLATIEQEEAVAEAAASAPVRSRFAGLEVIVGDAAAAEIAAAWGKMPPEAWDDAMADMRAHFGRGN